MTQQHIIVIGAPVPAPPGPSEAWCQMCGATHKVQAGTAKTIEQLGSDASIRCWACLRASGLAVDSIIGVREGREALGLDD